MIEASEAGEGIAAHCRSYLSQLSGSAPIEHRVDGLWMLAPALDVVAMAEAMGRMGTRLTGITGVALAGGETGIIYHYCLGSLTLNVKTETRNRAIPSIAPITQTADWSEREICDLYGVHFVGHPNLTRLIRPPALSAGFFRDGGDGGERS